MSVTLVKQADIANALSEARRAKPQPAKSFFEFLDVSACSINCSLKRDLDQNFQRPRPTYASHGSRFKREMRTTQNQLGKEYAKVRQEWFSAPGLAASAKQGCEFCNAIDQIIIYLFPGDHDQYEYSIGPDFEIQRRPVGTETQMNAIALFQPKRVSAPLKWLRPSEVLYDKDVSMQRVRGWINECLHSHEACSEHMASQDNNIRPTRLLDLTPLHRLGKPGIRLVVTAANNTYQYACLSHRWDDRLKQHQLNVGNLARRLDFMILEDLPKNFHDAVSIARELGIQYLWIDTLCIIQSGDNGKDLEKELANMGYIYRNSYLTIAAVASADSAGGCLSNSMFRDMCFIISNTQGETHLIGARVLDQKGTVATIEDAVQRYPLFTRGWVWQERLLSPRLLQCDYGEFSFHCLKLKSCECGSRLPPHILKLRQAWPGTLNWEFRRYLSPVTRLSPNNDKGTLMSCWRTITERFMQLELSVASDVLPAIAGCAEAIAYHRNFKYVAGMWKETLSTDLLWFVWPHKPFGFGKARPVQLSIPSWSWASMAMPQRISYTNPHAVNKQWSNVDLLLDDMIKEVFCEPESTLNPFGRPKRAYLKVHAVLYPWFIRWFCINSQKQHTDKFRRAVTGLHVRRSKEVVTCTTHTKELEIADTPQMDLFFDSHPETESLTIEPFLHCTARTKVRCGLSKIFLLHSLHRIDSSGAVDVFLLLKRTLPVDGKPNCYRRIGLWSWARGSGGPTWAEITQGRTQPQQEELWLF